MSRHRLPREAGVIVALFVLTLPVLLSLSMLALDTGRLYQARQNVNKATRIAALVGMSSVSTIGWGALVTPDGERDALGYKTGQVTQLNPPAPNTVNQALLTQMGQAAATTLAAYYPNDFQGQPGALTSQFLTFNTSDGIAGWQAQVPIQVVNANQTSVALAMRYDVNTLLMGGAAALAGAPGCGVRQDGSFRCTVQSSPTNQAGFLKPANIFLLLDTSGSMASPAAGQGQTKLQVLQQAVTSFIDMFNPVQDRISVIDFGTTVKTQTNLATFFNSTGDHLAIKDQIQALTAGGQTNPCDALIEAIREGQNAQLRNDDATFAIIFTDGSPNAGRYQFCEEDPQNPNVCNEPNRLTQARQAAQDAPDETLGWYNTTVKWGRRTLASCPKGAGLTPADCDPFYGWPALKDNNGQSIPLDDIQSHLRLNEVGEFVWLNGTIQTPINSAGLKFGAYSGPFTLQFEDLTRQQDNYLWHGPSYLWHASFRVPAGASIIDRIPQSMGDPVTCGPGSRRPFPGSTDPTSRNAGEMYTHSRYFASRVLNRLWRLDGTDPQNGLHREKTGLSALFPARGSLINSIPSPNYFTASAGSSRPPPMSADPNQSPGCLTSLNAQIPFTDARIYAGDSFISNLSNEEPSNSSIRTVGEIVKTAEMPYYCALRAADFLRSQRVVVFVVGLGPSATNSASSGYGASCTDPLQNALDFESRKDYFLRRLAFAPESLANPAGFMAGLDSAWDPQHDFGFQQREISGCNNHPLSGLKVNMGYGEASSENRVISRTPQQHGFTPGQLGAYYGSNDPTQLGVVFANVAKQILVRLST
jgi:hypothetical protein